MNVLERNDAVVLGLTGALNVKTTEAEGDTPVAPLAGLLVTVTCPFAWVRTKMEMANVSACRIREFAE